MTRLIAVALTTLVLVGCGDDSNPTGPSPTPSPSASRVSLTGTVSVTGTTVRLGGVDIRILDGVNAGRSAVTAENGTYRLDDLTAGNGNVSATASGWGEARAGVTINGTNTLDFSIQTLVPWTGSGTGNRVFDKPLWVTRTRVQGQFNGFSSNFVVWCGSSLVVNELLGTGWSSTRYDGTHSTTGCREMRVENSTGVTWTLSELR
jgi:hypothetical protein